MADAELDPSSMKVNELKEALRARGMNILIKRKQHPNFCLPSGLNTTGVKATLQARYVIKKKKKKKGCNG